MCAFKLQGFSIHDNAFSSQLLLMLHCLYNYNPCSILKLPFLLFIVMNTFRSDVSHRSYLQLFLLGTLSKDHLLKELGDHHLAIFDSCMFQVQESNTTYITSRQ